MKKIITMLCLVIVCCVLTGCDSSDYKKACNYLEQGDYPKAIEIFSSLGDYKDSLLLLEESKCEQSYVLAVNSMNDEKFEDAIKYFNIAGKYKDSIELCAKAQKELDYLEAVKDMESGNYAEAYNIFSQLDDFSDSKKMLNDIEDLAKTRIIENYKDACTYVKDFYINESAAIAAILQTGEYSSMYSGYSAVIVDANYMKTSIENIIKISADLPFANDVKYQCEKILPLYSELANYTLSSSTTSITKFHDLINSCDDTAMDIITNELTPIIIDWYDSIHNSTSSITNYNNGYIPYFTSIIKALE